MTQPPSDSGTPEDRPDTPGDSAPQQPGPPPPAQPYGQQSDPYGQQQPGQYGQYGGQPPQYQQPPRVNGMSIASLVTSGVGLVTFLFCGITALLGPVGLVLGFVALSQIKRGSYSGGSKGMAIGGIVIGALLTLLIVAGIVLIIVGAQSGWFDQFQNMGTGSGGGDPY